MTDQQMELGLGNALLCQSVSRRQHRLNRASWWFDRMRRIVEGALDWQPAPAPRPEQIWLPESRLQSRTAEPTPEQHERQICE